MPIVALVLILCVTVFLVPWKEWIGGELKRRLEARGFQNVELTISRIGFKSVILENLSIGEKSPLVIQNVTMGYSVSDLLRGNADSLDLEGLALQIMRINGSWVISGAEGSKEGKVEIPVSQDEIAGIPLNAAKIENSSIHLASSEWQMNIPLLLSWQKTPIPLLSYSGQNLNLKVQNLAIDAGGAFANATLDSGVWKGNWQIKDIKVSGAQTSIPPLEGRGQLKGLSDRIDVDGEFTSADKAYTLSFMTQYFLNASEKSFLTLRNASMPWNEGALSVQQVRIPFTGNVSVPIDVKVEKVSADALLRQLTGEKATATGEISGVLPIVWKADGTVEVRQGALNSEAPGVIKMAPDAIPGDNPQVALVRDVLADFHYSALSIQAGTGNDNRLSIRMNLEGYNPAAQGGRPVKLSVNLSGDVLGFVEQNLLWLTNPEKFLEQVK